MDLEVGKMYHMRVSVRGVLLKSDQDLQEQWVGAVCMAGKPCITVCQVREVFINELAQGHEFVPLGECEGFDYVAGCCPGHPVEEEAGVCR